MGLFSLTREFDKYNKGIGGTVYDDRDVFNLFDQSDFNSI